MSEYYELVHGFSHDNKNYKLFKSANLDDFVLRTQAEDGLFTEIVASGHFRLMVVFLHNSIFKGNIDT